MQNEYEKKAKEKKKNKETQNKRRMVGKERLTARAAGLLNCNAMQWQL